VYEVVQFLNLNYFKNSSYAAVQELPTSVEFFATVQYVSLKQRHR